MQEQEQQVQVPQSQISTQPQQQQQPQTIFKRALPSRLLLKWIQPCCDTGVCFCRISGGARPEVFIWNYTAYRRMKLKNILCDMMDTLREHFYFPSKLNFLRRSNDVNHPYTYKQTCTVLRHCLRAVRSAKFHPISLTSSTATKPLNRGAPLQVAYHIDITSIYEHILLL